MLDILKYTLPGVGVVIVLFYLIKPYLDRFEQLKVLDLKKNTGGQALPLKLQAYERIVLFIERVNPANMLVRLNAPSFSAAELHTIMITEIRNEFQHNVTQQIYVSERAWNVVKRVKDNTVTVVNNAAAALPENATGLDLGKMILVLLSQTEDNFYDTGTALLRKDVELLF
ncbi:MAG: hypothetical protein ABIN95_00235 [Mucilaginibacter sp.]